MFKNKNKQEQRLTVSKFFKIDQAGNAIISFTIYHILVVKTHKKKTHSFYTPDTHRLLSKVSESKTKVCGSMLL